MPTTYTSSRVGANIAGKYQEKGTFWDGVTYEAANASAIVANDIIQMIKVPGASAPNGIIVLDVILSTDDLGTCTFDLGDGDDADYLIDGLDTGATAGAVARRGSGVSLTAAAGFPKVYTTDDTIDIKVATSSANVVGTIRLDVLMVAAP